MAAGASVPAHRPQRGDQHRHRQRELDAGPRGVDQDRRLRVGSRRREVVPDLHPGRLRHRALRRGARTAPPGRAQPGARGADDDPRGLGAQRVDGPRAAGVLPVPRLVDGAVGRPGVDDVHRRHHRRRRARPKRPAPVADLGHRRRLGGDGFRGRRARPGPGQGGPPDAAAARPDVPGGHRAGPHRRRRGDQGGAGRRASLSGVARQGPGPARRPAGGRVRADAPRSTRQAAVGFRLHLRGTQPVGGADGAHRRRADRLDGHRHPGRGALAATADAVRLLPAALRPGDQPAAGRHPRGGGDQPAGHHRRRARPAQPGRELLSPDRAAAADPA